jgi:hypothetical protein
MNERIKPLYEQAHIERRQEYFSSEVDPTIKSVSVTRHFDPDLFAELIVKECMSIVSKSGNSKAEVLNDLEEFIWSKNESI